MVNMQHLITTIELLNVQYMKPSIDCLQPYHQHIIFLELINQQHSIYSLKENQACLALILGIHTLQETMVALHTKEKLLVMRKI